MTRRRYPLMILINQSRNHRYPLINRLSTRRPWQSRRVTRGDVIYTIKIMESVPGGGGTRMARGGIRLVYGLTKSTLITYYLGMKKDPKYAFLQAFFSICLSYSFQHLSIWYDQKHTLFPNFARFCTPKRCTRVQCLILRNNPNYVNFWTSLIPPWHSSGPPGVCVCE